MSLDHLSDWYEVELTLTEEMLGTVPMDKELYTSYVAAKGLDAGVDPEDLAGEVETVPGRELDDLEKRGWTGFHEDDGRPFIYSYMITGFLKEAAGSLRRVKGTKKKSLSSKLSAYKKVIDGCVFPHPRRIYPEIPADAEGVSVDEDGRVHLGYLERSLRADTPQGPRTALVRSDVLPVDTKFYFKIQVIGPVSVDILEEWFSYGALKGLGQWRSGGNGRFDYTIKEVSE